MISKYPVVFVRLSLFLFSLFLASWCGAENLVTYKLSISVAQGGQVTSPDLSGFTCNQGTCTVSVPAGSTVKLSSKALYGYKFKSWSGGCSGTDPNACVGQINADTLVKAYFSPIEHTLKTTATVGGSVMSLVGGINCVENICYNRLRLDSELTLTALPRLGYTFAGWSNACGGVQSDCRLKMDSYKAVTANFVVATQQISSLELRWSTPTLREDGSSLTAGEIKQHTIYYGKTSGVYDHAVTVLAAAGGLIPTSIVINGLQSGVNYYFAGITVDTRGLSSQLSTEISRVVN